MSNTDAQDNTPSEVALGRLTAGVARLLEREMDGIFQGLLHDAWHGPESPIFPTAQLANRIDGLRPGLRKSVGDEGEHPMDHVAGCGHALLGAEHHHVTGRVGMPVKLDV